MAALVQESVTIAIEVGHDIGADLAVPGDATGLVVFAHGSGSSRFSARNRAVAGSLQARGFGTLLIDWSSPISSNSSMVAVHAAIWPPALPPAATMRCGSTPIRAAFLRT